MTKSINARVQRLEAQQPKRIILEVAVNGKIYCLTAKEFVAAGLDFFSAQIVAGNSLADAKLLLDQFPSCIN